MSIETEVKKARLAEQRLLEDLNAQEGWLSRHPGWVTLIVFGLLLVIAVVAKGCHH